MDMTDRGVKLKPKNPSITNTHNTLSCTQHTNPQSGSPHIDNKHFITEHAVIINTLRGHLDSLDTRLLKLQHSEVVIVQLTYTLAKYKCQNTKGRPTYK